MTLTHTIKEQEVRILCLNVNGISNKKKRQLVYNWIRNSKADIVLLQETHCGSEEEAKKWQREWEKASYWSTFSSAARGVAILMNSTKDITCHDIEFSEDGRLIHGYFKPHITNESKSFYIINV